MHSKEFEAGQPGSDATGASAVEIIWSLEDKPQDECGVAAVYSLHDEPVVALAITAIGDLQNRGRSGAGVAVVHPDEGIVVHKGLGKILEVFSDLPLDSDGRTALDRSIQPTIAVSHTRYSTSGLDTIEATHPHVAGQIALCHNGELQNIEQVAAALGVTVDFSISDSNSLTQIIDSVHQRTGNLEESLRIVLPLLDGAYCLTITDGNQLFAVRDPWGVHPLVLGTLESGGTIVASEPVAFRRVGAELLRDVNPGEIVCIDEHGMRSSQIDRPVDVNHCAYEFFYTARADNGNKLDGVSVYEIRRLLGSMLGEDYPYVLDVVIGMPDTGTPAAVGFSHANGAPYAPGVFKNPDAGRSFQQKGAARKETLQNKAWVIPEEIEGRRVAVIDDSMIKGNTNRANIGALWDAGALEVHVILAAPPYKYSCRMGQDTGDPNELIANRFDLDTIAEEIGATSVTYITTERVQQAFKILSAGAAGKLCMACTTGDYPYVRSSPFERNQDSLDTGAAAGALALRQGRKSLPIRPV